MIKLIFILLLISSNSNASIQMTGIRTSGGFKINNNMPLVMCVGDSITYGTSNSGFGYRAKLQDYLGIGTYRFVGRYSNPRSDQFYDTLHEGLQVGQPVDNFNTGYTASMNTRGQESLGRNFIGSQTNSIVLFHGGTNNVKQESGGFLDETDAVTQIIDSPLTTASFVGYTVTNFPNVSIYVALIVPSPNGANDTAFTSYNTLLQTRLAAIQGTYPKVHIVDMNSAFKANASWSTYYFAYKLHPTSSGYDLMALTWYNCIQSALNTYCDGH